MDQSIRALTREHTLESICRLVHGVKNLNPFCNCVDNCGIVICDG